jgi:ribonuclease HII
MSEIPNTNLDELLKIKTNIVGCDEVGTGSWAGPLVVVGVRAPREWALEGLNDSKKLSPKKRETMSATLEKLIASGDLAWSLAERSNAIIDQIGLGVALKDAYCEVFKRLYGDEALIISDGVLKFDNEEINAYDKVSIVKADTKFAQVMAASILAKVYRDSKMKLLHKQYPNYGWDSNVGYHSATHMAGLLADGPCPLHRHSYKPIKEIILSRRNLSLF